MISTNTISIQATSNGFVLLPTPRGDYVGLDQAQVFNQVEDLCTAVACWANSRERCHPGVVPFACENSMAAAMSGNGNFSVRQ